MKRTFLIWIPLAVLCTGLAGCGSSEPEATKPGSTSEGRPNGAGQTPVTKGGMEDPHSMPPAEGEKVDLAALKKAQADADAAFKKAPNDAKAMKAFVDATVKLGTATMNAPELAPREKYAGALKYYRIALKVDPKNEEAKGNSQMIEDIYKQMGRPIPE